MNVYLHEFQETPVNKTIILVGPICILSIVSVAGQI